MKPASRLAALLLFLVAVVHLLRLAFQVEVVAGGTLIPMWLSVIGCLVPAALALGVWRESRAP